MSKQGKRKAPIDVKSKDSAVRPSVFERLGTKKSSAKKPGEYCRQWAQNGSCAYGKSCKFASTHTLISPSKQRAANKDSEKRLSKDDSKSRLHSAVVVRSGRSPDGEIDNWDQNDLEYADTDVLEKRRKQLQRELELQLKMDTGKDGRKKKAASSSSSSRSSSSSSLSSSSSGGSSSSSSSDRAGRRKGKKGKLKRNSSSSSDGDIPSKKKYNKDDPLKRDRNETKKSNIKKDDRLKKQIIKRGGKSALEKKSLSPGKKSGGTPPINVKSLGKGFGSSKLGKSPLRRNRSLSPHSAKDREKDRIKEREKERERERDRNRGRSKSRKARSRSPRPHTSGSKDLRRKDSSERSRQISPKKLARRDGSLDKNRKSSKSKDRNREHKDRSLERRKDKHDEKDRHDRKDRGRERGKEVKRDDKRKRGGLGRGAAVPNKGLAKPNKPMERLLPRPEERLAALAAISSRATEPKSSGKDRQESRSERGRKERTDRVKRDRLDSIDREPGDFGLIDRPYEHGHSVDRYDREDRYSDDPRDDDRSPGYRERRYDPTYDMAGPQRYPEDDQRYDDRRPRRDRSWDGRPGSMERERGYIHPHKEWEGEDYRPGGEWGRDRNWAMHEPPMGEWGDKDPEMEGWHHRGHPPGPHRPRVHDEYNRGMRMDRDKRRAPPRSETEVIPETNVVPPQTSPPARQDDDDIIPDDLSEISDDPDDILDREDMMDQSVAEETQHGPVEDIAFKAEASENQSTQDTSGGMEDKDSQDTKDEEENVDFEEISDGELEDERTRAGLGDALGVDWASLVADVQRREEVAPTGGLRDRWRPERVLTRLGISLEMAGRDLVQSILDKNESNQITSGTTENGDVVREQNGDASIEDSGRPTVDTLHPVAAIQVAIENRRRHRGALFGSGCEIRRALCARRDLALRRHLCRLPPVERSGQTRITPHPTLFHTARTLLMQ